MPYALLPFPLVTLHTLSAHFFMSYSVGCTLALHNYFISLRAFAKPLLCRRVFRPLLQCVAAAYNLLHIHTHSYTHIQRQVGKSKRLQHLSFRHILNNCSMRTPSGLTEKSTRNMRLCAEILIKI